MGFGASFASALADRFGPRLSLTGGPVMQLVDGAARLCRCLEIVLVRCKFPAIGVLAIGMTITVPP